jgi:hypothetical protein
MWNEEEKKVRLFDIVLDNFIITGKVSDSEQYF